MATSCQLTCNVGPKSYIEQKKQQVKYKYIPATPYGHFFVSTSTFVAGFGRMTTFSVHIRMFGRICLNEDNQHHSAKSLQFNDFKAICFQSLYIF